MTRRGRRTPEQLRAVPMADWTPAEYRRMDDDKTYLVHTDRGTHITVTGINSAHAVAGEHGTFEEKR